MSTTDKTDTKTRDTSHFGLIDWDFRFETSRTFVHDICWYPSRFIPIIPAQLISALSSPGDTVLDPFCGAGTTAVEAIKAGRNSVSADLSPIACELTRTKTKLLLTQKEEPHELSHLRDQLFDLRASRVPYPQLFTNQVLSPNDTKDCLVTPNHKKNTDWYHPDTLEELTYIFHEINKVESPLFHDLAKALFVSILMAASGHRTGRSYTYFADNVKPKNNFIYKDALLLYSTKLTRFLKQYAPSSISYFPTLTAEVYQCDSRNLYSVYQTRCDLIITSPPYLGVTDYATGFRLAYLWYDFVSNLDELKSDEIGARYRRHSKPSNALARYKNDLDLATRQMLQVLKSRGYLCLVLGEPRRFFSEIREFVLDRMQGHYGLTLQGAYTRQISKNFFLHPNGGVPTEEILVFRRH